MPRLKTVAPEDAQGRLRKMYSGLQEKNGKVFNIFQGMANSPPALQAYLSMSDALSQGELLAQDREAVYLAVSQANECRYCVSAHTQVAKQAGISDSEIKAARNFESESSEHQALLAFVRRVMETKGFVDDADVDKVHNAGYSDAQIAEAVGYIALATFSNYFNHVHDTPLDFPQAPGT